mgnify:CR=1 FL=1
MDNNKENKEEEMENKQPDEKSGVMIEGHIKIFDPNTKEEFVNKRNAIHYENFSNSMAQTMANRNLGQIYQMTFGNGGSSVDSSGVITYLPPNTTGRNAELYNQTFQKVVDDTSAANTDPSRNKLTSDGCSPLNCNSHVTACVAVGVVVVFVCCWGGG